MPVILTVFFYLDGCFAFTSLNAADDSLFWSRCKVQIPTIMSVINRLMRETNLSFCSFPVCRRLRYDRSNFYLKNRTEKMHPLSSLGA